MNIQNLPQELKLEIWSFLNYHDLCISERVCKEWLDLMRNNETDLWKKSYQTSFGSPVLLPLVCPWKSFVRKGHLINHSPATNHQSIILDISTNKVKVGLTHEKEPSVILKSDDVDLDEYINLYKLDSTTSLDLKNPNIKTYIVLIDMGLRAVPALLDHHPVCILLNTKTTRLIKEFLAYFMFEHYRVVALQLKPSRSTYITICEDRRNSVVVKIGNEETVITAFHDGWELTHTTIILPIGGKTITYKLLELLNHRKDLPDLIKNFECVNTIKEKLAFVSIDPESDRFKFSCYGNQLFMSLFDGSTVELRSESFECCEVLFQSTGEEPSGLIQGITKCISKCDESLQRDAWSNVILAGDTTLLNGLQHRIRRELVTCTNLYVDVISAQRHSSWKGACKFSETEYYWNQLVSKEEYEELGPSAFWPRYF